MCIEDIRLKRKTRTFQGTMIVSNASQDAIPANDKRVSLIVQCTEGTLITLSLQATAVLHHGIDLNIDKNPLTLSLDTHGDIVCKRFQGISAAGTERLLVIETVLDEV